MEALRTVSKEERDEMAQEQERATERALSTLAAASHDHVDTASRRLESLMSQVKEDLTAHATEERHHRLIRQEAQLVPINVCKHKCVCVLANEPNDCLSLQTYIHMYIHCIFVCAHMYIS